MPQRETINLDVAIFGGGGAGLFLLDRLMQAGYAAALIEANDLATGQTIASQGIIHGGLKYTLDGLLSDSAAAIREMPQVWRECLAGDRKPDLRGTRVLSEFCYLWRTSGLRSRVGMIGARAGLRTTPQPLPREEWPDLLRGCGGEVFTIGEQVVDPLTLAAALAAAHESRILHVDATKIEFSHSSGGHVDRVSICTPDGDRSTDLRPESVVLAAGEGNADLRQQLGLAQGVMQRRPLHMVLVRGDLPGFYGHCTDGAATRVTITTNDAANGDVVWQIGGQVAEVGVEMDADALIRHARGELTAVMPAIARHSLEWATYKVNRAEAATPGGKRPSGTSIVEEGNVITAWPTKLALAPALADQIHAKLPPPQHEVPAAALADWPRPAVAQPPWERVERWTPGG